MDLIWLLVCLLIISHEIWTILKENGISKGGIHGKAIKLDHI